MKASVRFLRQPFFNVLGGMIGAALASSAAGAQTSESTNAASTPQALPEPTADDIIVTAQKRSERLNEVPLSITAASGEQLAAAGVVSTADLSKIVPGFNYQQSAYGPPVFNIRGIGFYDTSIGSSPTVSIYVDQVALPFSVMAEGATLDLERVEALKGPQGTLFGQNSTGGAINYIAAKPTDRLSSGFSVSVGRFDQVDSEAFVSGPISDTLRARVALRHESRGDWQRSHTRDDTLGQRDFSTGRFLLDWEPAAGVKFELNLNGWLNRSDTAAAQFRFYRPTTFPDPGYPEQIAALTNYPVAPDDARAADWDAGQNYRRDDRFYQASLRADIDLSDSIALTSITAYSDLNIDSPIDVDGTAFNDLSFRIIGEITSFSQEVRLALTRGPIRATLGGNYERNITDEGQFSRITSSNSGVGPFRFTFNEQVNDQDTTTIAAFGALDFALTSTLSVQGAARYTSQQRDGAGCYRDLDGQVAAAFGAITGVVVPTGTCVTIRSNGQGLVERSLDEDNLSWRGGISWIPSRDLTLYANVTKGYKVGGFSTQPLASEIQYVPVTQESVLAYEAGVKASLLDRKVEVTAAAFYYDYKDKQILGSVNGGLFGFLPSLVNIPESSVRGAELTLNVRPTRALTLTGGVTYVDSRVDSPGASFLTPDPFGNRISIEGERFPNTPLWQAVGSASYTVPLGDSLNATVGGNISYRGESYAAFGELPLFKLNPYALIDLRLRLESDGGPWSAEIWGRNITDKYYWNNVARVIDTVARNAGMPATYGVTLGYRY